MIEHEPSLDIPNVGNSELRDLSFYWYKQIPLKEVNHGYLGPTVHHVKEYYKDLIEDDMEVILQAIKANKEKET